MSELAKRIAFSLIAAPVVVVAVWFGGAALAALLSIAAGLGAWEFYRLAKSCGAEPMWWHGIIGAALVPLGVHAQYLGLSVPPLGVLMLVVLELLAVALLWRGGRGKPLEVVGITILGIFYIGGMLSYAYALRYHPYAIGAAAGAAVVVLPLFCTWATDIGGYVFGRWLGKRKLMPTVSPGKTVAGAIGGIATSIAICLVFVQFVLRPVGSLTLSWWGAVIFAIAISVAGQIGDLVESMLKREAGVKDSSRLIPGHGGVLDRVDSLLFTLPVAYVLLGFLLIPAPQ